MHIQKYTMNILNCYIELAAWCRIDRAQLQKNDRWGLIYYILRRTKQFLQFLLRAMDFSGSWSQFSSIIANPLKSIHCGSQEKSPLCLRCPLAVRAACSERCPWQGVWNWVILRSFQAQTTLWSYDSVKEAVWHSQPGGWLEHSLWISWGWPSYAVLTHQGVPGG